MCFSTRYITVIYMYIRLNFTAIGFNIKVVHTISQEVSILHGTKMAHDFYVVQPVLDVTADAINLPHSPFILCRCCSHTRQADRAGGSSGLQGGGGCLGESKR